MYVCIVRTGRGFFEVVCSSRIGQLFFATHSNHPTFRELTDASLTICKALFRNGARWR
jgi:hypothetical protein